MSTGGYGQGGSSTAGPSSAFDLLPYRGYRELDDWFEEFIDAVGIQLDILYTQYGSPDARANLIDPTADATADNSTYFATSTAAATQATSQDTMLNVIGLIALGLNPLNVNLTVAQRQALAAIGWDAVRRKGTRQSLLKLAAAMMGDVVYGWTSPPYSFSLIAPDGAPSPGWGSWVPTAVVQTGTVDTTSGVNTISGTGTAFTSNWIGYTIIIGTNAYTIQSITNPTSLALSENAAATESAVAFYIVTGESIRPWLLEAVRNVCGRYFPAWSEMGVGYSQFRAGYSAAGEPTMASGSRLNLLTNGSFSAWTGASPTSWTASGAITKSGITSGTNYEFSNYVAKFDLSAAAAGSVRSLSQSSKCNNQVAHVFELDYAYTNSQNASHLYVTITDADDSSVYDSITETWGTSTTYSALAPISATRGRYSFTFTPKAASNSASTLATTNITVSVSARSDGTSTTKVVYTLFRVAVHEKHDADIEAAAQGERTLWLPLVDSPGWTTFTRTAGGGVLLEPASYNRATYKTPAGTTYLFPYHPALSDRGYCSSNTWTNLLLGSNDFVTDWTLASGTLTAASVISPILGETVATAPSIAATAKAASIRQGSLGTPTSDTYCGGIWVKKTTADVGNQAGTITITAGSAAVTGVSTAFDSSWIGHDLITSVGRYRVSAVGSTTALTLAANAQTTETAVTFQLTDIKISLESTANYYRPFTLTQAQGWQLLPFNITLGAGDLSALIFRVSWGAASATQTIAVANAYLYEVTGKVDVLYPPVVQTIVGASKDVKQSFLRVTTNTTGTDILHPLTLRQVVSVKRGSLFANIVPAHGAGSGVSQFLIDYAQTLTQNRLSIRRSSTQLVMERISNSGSSFTATLDLTTSLTPTSTQVTWLRDTVIPVRAIWDETSFQLSAGDSNVRAVFSGDLFDTSVASIGVGCRFDNNAGNNSFDGWIRDLEFIQVGEPIS